MSSTITFLPAPLFYKTMKKLKAIGYIRTSKDEREKISPEQQRDAIKSYCDSQGWELVDALEDKGRSGKDLKRPAIQKILTSIKDRKNKFEVVVCWKTDRITRKLSDLLEILKFFEKSGIAFKSVVEPVETISPMGKAFIQIIGVFAELEWGNCSLRSKATADKLKKDGRLLGAKYLVPFGFKKINGGRSIEDLKPNGEFKTLQKILNQERPVKELVKETGMAQSSIYYIRSNPVYKVLV